MEAIGKNLPDEFPLHWIRQSADPGRVEQIGPLFEDLFSEVPGSLAELEGWLQRYSELAAYIRHEEEVRLIQNTQQTADPERERRYLDFIEKILPLCEPHWFKIKQLILKYNDLYPLPRERYRVLLRNAAAEVEIYREENVPLLSEEQRLAQQYQKILGAMTVQFEGRERTLAQMTTFMERTSPKTRQEAFEAVTFRRLKDREDLEDIFDNLIRVRTRIARNAGFANYRDYIFKKYRRFDYTPEDCFRFHDSIEAEVMPLVKRLQAERMQNLGLKSLRPYDLLADPQGRAPLKPFTTGEELARGCCEIYHRIDPVLGSYFDFMREHELLDLESRKGKGPGAFCHVLELNRLPYLFMSAAGMDRDIVTLLHESGHAFNQMEFRHDDLFDYRYYLPWEFAEVASMAMECLGSFHIEAFYNAADAQRSRTELLTEFITLLPWIATIDAYQHWLYTNPDHDREQRAAAWIAIRKRFGGLLDWSGYEHVLKYEWQKQLHLYGFPLYYIEYGIASLGALQVWRAYRHDPAAAVAAYRRGLKLGGSKTLPELFAAAGIRFDFSRAALASLMREVSEAIVRMGEG